MQSKRSTRLCAHCSSPFDFWPWMAKGGGGRFCSRSCYWASIGPRQTLTQRLAANIDTSSPDGCWEWTGFRDPNGYGRLMTRNQHGKYAPMLAHRLVWIAANGPVPDEIVVRHAVCGNPPCCRLDHLAEGTQAENSQDTIRHGRTTQGERSASAKLTDATVREIRARYAAGNISQAKLAADYGLHQMTVSDIIRGVTWRHLT